MVKNVEGSTGQGGEGPPARASASRSRGASGLRRVAWPRLRVSMVLRGPEGESWWGRRALLLLMVGGGGIQG